jgi:Ni,Fe-hydrogenase maturation factor
VIIVERLKKNVKEASDVDVSNPGIMPEELETKIED